MTTVKVDVLDPPGDREKAVVLKEPRRPEGTEVESEKEPRRP